MENQNESNRKMQNDLRKELNIRKRIEELFYIIEKVKRHVLSFPDLAEKS